ncbi:xylan 1,4-beta-xylosidase [Streptomyces sp. LX-29]|uniref:xylan 1,4-beta-xylosidase n=1 Tax=Streptomyces sp. LX-29 TaxID=2900152 RepID=UPI00240E36FE|nr:xylan 1,4-beta-xylosidase [Streptomyces sp. LX-29]WFB10305.1 xylan 1,4-beta-xylosidase [Streptomyces sp. LX-29]
MLFRAGRWRLTTLLGAVVVALALLLTTCAGWPGGDAKGTTAEAPAPTGPTTDPPVPPGPSPRSPGGPASPELGWGFTHTQYSADQGASDARRRADTLLSAQPMPQNQHIMGWGADNPEPSPDRYDFRELDRRVALMRATDATPVLTLCCAPDWMKGGQAGRTDWSQRALETAPDPEHYADFAQLAGEIAHRYPDVRHFIVWNEFKGFYDDEKRRWNYEGYTELYNLVYAELKKANRDNLVGGPYVVADSDPPDEEGGSDEVRGLWGALDQRSADAIRYWNEHKTGADFVVVDGSSYTREDDELIPDEFAATEKFASVTRWLSRTTGLPVWWAEWYVEPPADDGSGRVGGRDGWSERHRTAVQATAMMRLAGGGAATAFYWNPQETGSDCPGCLWNSTELRDGGEQLPMMGLLRRFARAFPPGTDFRPVTVTTGDAARIEVLADDAVVLVVNTEDRRVGATVDGQELDLSPYEVRWLSR